MQPYQETNQNVLKVTTLGGFDITYNGISLLGKIVKSNKVLDLLKYLITHKNKKILPENIIDQLSMDHDFDNPNNVLRSQIFRLRKWLAECMPREAVDEFINIQFVGRYYILGLSDKVILDTDVFENKAKEAKKIMDEDGEKAVKLFREVIQLYAGAYLAEDTGIWVMPMRNYYSRWYLNTAFYLIDILKEEGKYADIIEICEEVLEYELTEETVHIAFIEALCKQGYKKHAMSHYEYITLSLIHI